MPVTPRGPAAAAPAAPAIAFVAVDRPPSADDWTAAMQAGATSAFAPIVEAARAGDVRAQTALGRLLLTGSGIAADAPSALAWFLQAARGGHAEAANMVGRCYELGWGTGVDPAIAGGWYRRAADAGDAWAQFNLAMLQFDGHGCRVDRAGALAWFLRSARGGNAKAMNMLGRYREEGWTGGPQTAAAARWYRRAAEGGDFRGQFNHGRLLWAAGRHSDALPWLARAIDAGIPVFCRNVAADLADHPDAALRALAVRAGLRARGGDQGEPLMRAAGDPAPNGRRQGGASLCLTAPPT